MRLRSCCCSRVSRPDGGRVGSWSYLKPCFLLIQRLDFPAVGAILYQRCCGKTLISPHFMRFFSNRNQKSPQKPPFMPLQSWKPSVSVGTWPLPASLKEASFAWDNEPRRPYFELCHLRKTQGEAIL